jgi:hypothetical protein
LMRPRTKITVSKATLITLMRAHLAHRSVNIGVHFFLS